jgi:hypothetical protein
MSARIDARVNARAPVNKTFFFILTILLRLMHACNIDFCPTRGFSYTSVHLLQLP